MDISKCYKALFFFCLVLFLLNTVATGAQSSKFRHCQGFVCNTAETKKKKKGGGDGGGGQGKGLLVFRTYASNTQWWV